MEQIFVAPSRGQDGLLVLAAALRGGWAVMNSLKDANGTPKPSSHVNCVGTRDRLRGASPTNGLRPRSTRSTPGAGLTAGANRTRRAWRRGEGVQVSSGSQRRAVCVMQRIGHVHGNRTSAGPAGSPDRDACSRGATRARTGLLAGERSALKGACCVREGPAGKAHRACLRTWPGGCSLAGYLTLRTCRTAEELNEPR
jgi:hypothetical protein